MAEQERIAGIDALRGLDMLLLTGGAGIVAMETSNRAKIFGAVVVLLTIALYIIFW